MFFKNRGNARRIACIWHDAVSFHGNGCPLFALGVRVCDTALIALEITKPRTENLVCGSEYSGCCVDALQVALHTRPKANGAFAEFSMVLGLKIC